MLKINEMKCGNDNVEFVALITHVTLGKTNGANKSNYLSIVFQDETGCIDAKLWNATKENIESLIVGTVVTGKGDIIKYSDGRQMKLTAIISISSDETEQIKYLKNAPIDSDDMILEISAYINNIKNLKLHSITKHIFEEHLEKITVYPAASKNHHEYVSGLAYHTLSMLKLADSIIQIYKQVNSDLIYAGIILHDVGKTVELSGPIIPSYTLEGKLLGHISIASAMIANTAKELQIEGEEVTLLQHIILSHHGKNEFGSPVLPQIIEAEIVHMIDNMDARIQMFLKTLEQTETGEYSKRVFALENRAIYKPKMYNK